MNSEWTQATFWSTTGQVIPVLGLALVIEARLVARNWTPERKIRRRVEATVVAVLALALSIAFGETLSILATAVNASSWRVTAISLILQITFSLLAVSAVLVVFTRGTADLNVLIDKWVPFSLTRRLRRRVKRTLRGLPEIVREVWDVQKMAEAFVMESRARLQAKSLLSDEERTNLREFLDRASQEAKPRIEVLPIASLRASLDIYEQRPSRARAHAVRSAELRVAIHLLARTRLRHVTLLGIRDDAESLLADLTARPMSDLDAQIVAKLIAAAGEPGLFPWRPASMGDS